MHKEKSKPKKTISIQNLAINFLQTRGEGDFKELMNRLKPGLMLFVSKYANGDRDLCNEIVSQTFISIWEKINQYDPRWNFSTWAYAIAKNEALGQLRIMKRNLSHDQMTANQSKLLKVYSSTFSMDIECIGPSGEDLTKHLYDLSLNEIQQLEEPYKTVIFEREVNKKQLQDIAEILNWNLNTVKTRLRKARQDVADSLCKKYPELIEAYQEEHD